jgi:general secretion pathway protein J
VRRARGFTLVEVLLATALLAAGLVLAFATLVGATTAARRGEEVAQENERIRAVQGFLRRRLAGARAAAFDTDRASGLPMRFVGDATRMRFVADLPDYIGRGGPSLHDVRIERDDAGEGVQLQLDLAVVQAGASVIERGAAPEVLADGLREAGFRYRGLGADGKLAPWQDEWTAVEQLPLLVEIRLVAADGRPWPTLVVAPRLAAGYAGGTPQ